MSEEERENQRSAEQSSTIERLAAELRRAPQVTPPPLTGRERPDEVLASAFPAFVGRQLRTAYELMRRSIDGGHTVFLTVSGAMTPAGLHQSCLVPLVQRGLVDVISTTGANLYHDAHRVLGHRIREIHPEAGDRALRQARIIRIYDLGLREDVLLDTDRLFAQMLRQPAFQRPMTTVESNYLMGEQLSRIEAQLEVPQPCLLSACYQADVPIFVGAPQDGSIFLNAVKLKALLGSDFRYAVDAVADVYAMAALQWQAQREGQTAIWILGGGVPKNYTLQGEPTLSQIFDLDARGFDVDLQLCVDPVDNGALSSCQAGEAHTWGKVSARCVESSSVYVHCDVTAVFPWLTYALFASGASRPQRRLLTRVEEARTTLDGAVVEKREALLEDLARGVDTSAMGPEGDAA